MGENERMKHTFGPVPSRRLGFSLGVESIIEGVVCNLVAQKPKMKWENLITSFSHGKI